MVYQYINKIHICIICIATHHIFGWVCKKMSMFITESPPKRPCAGTTER